jgi:hypothetical protein
MQKNITFHTYLDFLEANKCNFIEIKHGKYVVAKVTGYMYSLSKPSSTSLGKLISLQRNKKKYKYSVCNSNV